MKWRKHSYKVILQYIAVQYLLKFEEEKQPQNKLKKTQIIYNLICHIIVWILVNFITRYHSGYDSNLHQPMLKLTTQYGFYELFLK